MKLKEFIEKFCYRDTDIKIRGISTNSDSIAYMTFQGTNMILQVKRKYLP